MRTRHLPRPHTGTASRGRGPTCAGLALLLLALVAAPLDAAVRIRPEDSHLDLNLMGFAVLNTNLMDRDYRLFGTKDGFPAEFTNRQMLHLRVEGTISKLVAMEARLHYDKENLRPWRYRLGLRGPRSQFAFGELVGAFQDTEFTRYDTPFYGMKGRVDLGPFSTRAFTTTRSGNNRVDRLRGTDLSGPYILTASPLLEGSERVAIEVRDRLDEERLLSSEFRERGLDYTIDYATGTILFSVPVAAETFEGNPVFVMVEYEYVPHSGAETDYLTGARLLFEPTQSLSLGTTYLRATGRDPGVLASEGLLGIDQRIGLGKWLRLDNEMSGPPGGLLDKTKGAWRMGLQLKPFGNLQLGVRYRRVGKDFDTTANPVLDMDRDRQEAQLDLSFLLSPEQRLMAGWNVKSDNVAGDPAFERTRTRSYFAGWESRMRDWPLLSARFERRLSDGPGSFGAGVSCLDSLQLDAEDSLGRWGPLGPTSIKAQYRLEDSRESGEGGNHRRSHMLRARLSAQPRRDLDTWLELTEARARDPEDDILLTRSHEILLGGHYHLADTLSLGANLRWRRDDDLVNQSGHSTRTTTLFDVTYQPSERLRALLRYEWTLSTSGSASSSSSRNLFAQAAVIPFDGLTASLGYKLDDRGAYFGGDDGRLEGEYFASLMYKRAERLTFFGKAERGRNEERLPPFEPTRSLRTTWLAGGSLDLTELYGVLGEFKDERLSGDVQAHRRAINLELSRVISRYLKAAVGISLTLDEQGETDRLEKQRLYLKLIGRL